MRRTGANRVSHMMLKGRPLGLCMLGMLATVGGLAGCGRKATESDCQAIIDRNVEVQMRKMSITDDAVIAKKKDEIHTQFAESMKGCIGRRITDGMMKCVKDAPTVEAIDACMH